MFETGEKRIVDLAPYLPVPIFKWVREDPEVFKRVNVAGGVLTWENGADADPDVLYYQLPPSWESASASPEES